MRLWIPANRPSSMPYSTRRPAARAAGSATSIRKARSARNKRVRYAPSTNNQRHTSDGNDHENEESQEVESESESESEIQGRHPEGRQAEVEEAGGQESGVQRPAAAFEQAVGTGRQGARRRAHPRLHPRAVGPHLHAAARLYGRRRDQDRAARRGRRHARAIARREGG